ncbi:TolC family protein [Meiothermus ruber]|uniref:TolC family protein n=1 Tax=Meiothermus ruber TaxID=277 RepID=UPI000349B7D5|nr:TolC family protein [Meiothermus ruber]MCX7802246.1 TolC family protein [Meiothermus ruber]GAO75202.1 outer membrane efflux protein [Meiothermus ruber H328]
MKMAVATRFVTPLTLLLSLALAQAQSLSLEAALAKATVQAPVIAAKAELDDANTNLQRVLSDPLLTRPSRVQAEQRAALAQASYERAVVQAQSSIVGAYAQVLEAQVQVRLAQKALEVAARGVEVAQIRQRNGSGTALDVRNAQNRLEEARSNLSRAENGLALAQASLRSLVGAFEALAPLPNPPAMPEAGVVQGLLNKNPDVLQARQRAELAQLQVELLDPSYAAQADIEAAKARAEQAAAGAREIERGLALQYDSLFQNLQAAARALSVQQAALANARETLANDKKRLDAGLISQVAYLQTELSFIQAELAAQQALGNYWRAYYSLLAGGR